MDCAHSPFIVLRAKESNRKLPTGTVKSDGYFVSEPGDFGFLLTFMRQQQVEPDCYKQSKYPHATQFL